MLVAAGEVWLVDALVAAVLVAAVLVAAVDVGTGVAVNPGDSARPAADEPAGRVGLLVTAETVGGVTVLVGDDGDALEEGSRVAPGADADPVSSPPQAAAVATNNSATGSSFPKMASRE